jgi:hypothetical protein
MIGFSAFVVLILNNSECCWHIFKQHISIRTESVDKLNYNKNGVFVFLQDRQCTYNVTLERVYETIVTVEKRSILRTRWFKLDRD